MPKFISFDKGIVLLVDVIDSLYGLINSWKGEDKSW